MTDKKSGFVAVCEAIHKIYAKSPELYRPSKFWERLNRRSTEQLTGEGYERFKQTTNSHYFQFMVKRIRDHYFTYFLPYYSNREFLKMLFRSRTKDCPLGFLRRLVYRTYVTMLYGYVKKLDRLRLIDRIREPKEGTPVEILYEGKIFSQDILNSLQEFYAIDEAAHLTGRESLVVGEIGAGHGRVGFLLANIFKGKQFKYCVFDIPPALCLSQHYLSRVFPDAKVLLAREFKKFSEIEKEFNEAKFCFFLPHQIELLPPKVFDLFIAISNFPEMTKAQVSNYFRHINRLCRGHFYNKQFWLNKNPNDKYTTQFLDYPVPANWSTLLLRPVAGKVDFFETVYRIGQ